MSITKAQALKLARLAEEYAQAARATVDNASGNGEDEIYGSRHARAKRRELLRRARFYDYIASLSQNKREKDNFRRRKVS